VGTSAFLAGNVAAAWGAQLAGAEYVPAFPITPQTEIVETLADWFAAGDMQGKFVTLDVSTRCSSPAVRILNSAIRPLA
jgi:pyruvate ferredoxin oxidoreductase alpha subunit